MNTRVILDSIQKSMTGEISFPQVVKMLVETGIESYHVDLVRGENTYYLSTGKNYVADVAPKSKNIAKDFSAQHVAAAIKSAQAGEIKYEEFLQKIMDAGTVFYIAYLQGKKVIYLGRNGDLHCEPF